MDQSYDLVPMGGQFELVRLMFNLGELGKIL